MTTRKKKERRPLSPPIIVDTAPLMQAIAELRKEVVTKVDALQASLSTFVAKTDHEKVVDDFERRVRDLEKFKAAAFGAMAVIGASTGAIGALISYALKKP